MLSWPLGPPHSALKGAGHRVSSPATDGAQSRRGPERKEPKEYFEPGSKLLKGGYIEVI